MLMYFTCVEVIVCRAGECTDSLLGAIRASPDECCGSYQARPSGLINCYKGTAAAPSPGCRHEKKVCSQWLHIHSSGSRALVEAHEGCQASALASGGLLIQDYAPNQSPWSMTYIPLRRLD